jgi:hypothetical protein
MEADDTSSTIGPTSLTRKPSAVTGRIAQWPSAAAEMSEPAWRRLDCAAQIGNELVFLGQRAGDGLDMS